jgi:hypothetical protein
MTEKNLQHELCYLESEVNNIKKFCQKCKEAGDPEDYSWKFRKCNINECNVRT